MATNSIRGLRRSPRLKKPPHSLPPRRGEKVPVQIPRRSFRLQNLSRKNRNENLRRSPRLKAAFFSEESRQCLEGLVKIGKISNVENLLKTGRFHGVQVTCFSEVRKGYLSGIIKGGGFLCGCSECNYKGEVLSAKMFEKHAGANTKFEADHVFYGNGLNLYEISQFVTNIPEDDVYVKFLQLRGDLKHKQLSDEPPLGPTTSIIARRSKRKGRETGFESSIASVENNRSKRSRKSLRLEDAVMNKELSAEEISCVKDLLKTGLLEGASITYIKEKNQVKLPGIIKGTSYVCGCCKCTYAGKALSARKFKEHAKCGTSNPNNRIILSNRISIFEVAKNLKGIHGSALKNKLDKLIGELEFRDHTHGKQYTNDKLEKDKSSEGSRQVLKCYRRYKPDRRLMDVRGLLSTGLLEGFRVAYIRNKARLAAYIRGAEYRCGCSSCNYTKVITAREIERHARELSDNPNENIYLDNGMTLCQLVKELKGIPLYILGNFLQEKIKCQPNYDSFEIWKGSFKVGDVSPSFRLDSERQPDSKQSSVHCMSRDGVSISEATKNIDKTSHVKDDFSMKNIDSNSDQWMNRHVESHNSNFQHCPVSEPIIVSNLAETFTDGVPESINDLGKDSVPKNIFQSESRVEVLISEATKNNIWIGNSSHVRDNDVLKNLDPNSDQCLNQPNESTNSNTQQCSIFEPTTVTDPAGTIMDGHPEGVNDLAKASVQLSSFEPYILELNTAPGSSGLDTPGPSISDGTSVVCKGSLNIVQDELHFGPASRKRRSPRIIKFIKCDENIHAGPSSLAEKTLQKVRFTVSGVESMTAPDVTEAATADPDYNHLESGSKEGLTEEEKTSLIGITVKKRGSLHKRIFEEGGLPDGTVLTYQHHNKVLLTGVKQGSVIKCACHNYAFVPSQFEAHAGMGQKRQPYQNIYNSDGKTLHELSFELPDIPGSGSETLNSRPTIHLQHKRRERTARCLVKRDQFVPTSRRLKRVFQSQKGVHVRCTVCKERRATLGDEADPKLVIFCNQCDRAYHIGCLEDHESFKIEDVINGNWFCCTDCTWVHNSLKKICTLGAKPVPTPFFDLLKKPHSTKNTPINLSWQIFRGGDTEDRVLLSQSLQFLKGVFKPILLGRLEMMRQMVFGRQVAGTGLDFRGVLFIVIKHNEEIVSVAALQVFGKHAAELPLATTSKLWRQQGYFRMLLSLVEELLCLLQVRLLVSPVHDKMQSVWIDKFGFAKASDQKVQMLKEQHGLMLFEDTSLLEKEIQAVTD